IYIYNHIAIERIFYMYDAFTSSAKVILDKLERTNKIDNFSNIRDKLLDDNRFIRRIAKLIEDDSRVTLFLDDLITTEKVVIQFNLNINVDIEKQKVYVTDDGQLNELINLMQDSYYQTLIGQRKGIDDIN
ncbi:Kiwa anti-phage protein KwaB-like domain-containing protein, partial [Staphylococcus cohnii]